MNMQFQNLNLAIPVIQQRYKKNPRRSISATFRQLRNQQRFSFFGDYPILATVLDAVMTIGIIPARPTVTYALNSSNELRQLSKKEKMELINQLFNPSPAALKQLKKLTRQLQEVKMNNVSVAKKERIMYA